MGQRDRHWKESFSLSDPTYTFKLYAYTRAKDATAVKYEQDAQEGQKEDKGGKKIKRRKFKGEFIIDGSSLEGASTAAEGNSSIHQMENWSLMKLLNEW